MFISSPAGQRGGVRTDEHDAESRYHASRDSVGSRRSDRSSRTGASVIEVSVVIPTRDRRRLLAMTLKSVLRQRSVHLEVIVVDEASTDGTPSFVAAMRDPRISLIRHDEPRGPSAARNDGAARARGEWLAFVDDDDVWAPDKLARQLAAARSARSEWVYAGVVNVGPALEVVSGRPPPSPREVVAALPGSNMVPGGSSNVAVLREVAHEVGGFDERFGLCEDWELWARLAERSEPAAVASPLVGYRVHEVNRSLDGDRILREVALIESIHHGRVDRGRLHRWLAESYLRVDRRAAALGQLGLAVVRGAPLEAAGDLAVIARRRVRRAFGIEGTRDREALGDRWQRAAEPWLRELAEARDDSVADLLGPNLDR
jgi:hypothetical protein